MDQYKSGDLIHVADPSGDLDGWYLVTDVSPRLDGVVELELMPDPVPGVGAE